MTDKDAEIAALKAEVARLEDITGASVTVGAGLRVFGAMDAIGRVQTYILLDSRHPIEANDTRLSLARALQAAEARVAELEAETANMHEEICGLLNTIAIYQEGG